MRALARINYSYNISRPVGQRFKHVSALGTSLNARQGAKDTPGRESIIIDAIPS